MTKSSLKIDIVSDVSCPWCIIGYQALTQALNSLDEQADAQVSWKPFELNPAMPAEGQLLVEHLQEKYGSTPADVEATRRMITNRGVDLGFNFDFRGNGRIYNTFNAHRLLFWSRKFGKQTELKLALFKLYFSDGGNPGSADDLIKTVKSVGLPEDEAAILLNSEELAGEVRAEEYRYQSMGISSVPTFIINEKYMITGGQPVEKFVEILKKIVSEENAHAARV